MPDELYNSVLRNQKIETYIESYDTAIEYLYRVLAGELSYDALPEHKTRQDVIDSVILLYELGINFRVINIMERHLELESRIIINIIDSPEP